MRKSGFMRFVSLATAAAFALGFVFSCGGSGGGGGTTSITTPSQAAATSSAAAGAAALTTATVGAATASAAGSIPGPYAKTAASGSATDTTAIASIDPRLKTTVDKMVAQLRKPLVRNTISKTNAMQALGPAPVSALTTTVDSTCATSGTYRIVYDVATAGTTTTYQLSVTFNACKDNATHEMMNGNLTATHSIDPAFESANVTTTNLTDTLYAVDNVTVVETLVLNGAFNSLDNNGASGANSANGTFTATDSSGVYTFSFTNISDVWTKANSPGPLDTTDTHTGNGSFGFSITQPGGSLSLTIALSNLTDKLTTYFGGANDEWINGSVTISWSPDMSQWGCLNGTYAFTTADATPIHTPAPGGGCPTSGTLQVNNATLKFGVPSGTQVTVTINGVSQVFSDCTFLGGGMCN